MSHITCTIWHVTVQVVIIALNEVSILHCHNYHAKQMIQQHLARHYKYQCRAGFDNHAGRFNCFAPSLLPRQTWRRHCKTDQSLRRKQQLLQLGLLLLYREQAVIKVDASSAAFLGRLGALLYGVSQSVGQLKRVEVAVLRKEDSHSHTVRPNP